MNLEKYNEFTATTAVFPQEVKNFGIAYTFLGLIDEISELAEVMWTEKPKMMDINKESGDTFWYLSEFCNQTGGLIDFNKIMVDAQDLAEGNPVIISPEPLCSVAGAIKKFYRDGKSLDVNKIQSACTVVFENIISNLMFYNITVEEVLETNHLKLTARKANNTLKGDGDNR